MTNIPDTLEQTLKLYAPVLTRWMKQNRFHAIECFIGRDNPSALPVGKDSMAYGNKPFEKRAAADLKPLVEATYALQEACPVSAGHRERINVRAYRKDGGVVVEASISNRLGGVMAMRSSVSKEEGMFFVLPAHLVFTSDTDLSKEHAAGLGAAAEEGAKEAVRYLIDNDLILNWQGQDAKKAARGLKEFPLPGRVTVIDDIVKRIMIVSAHNPGRVLCSRAYLDDKPGLEEILRKGPIPFEVIVETAEVSPMTNLEAEEAETDAPSPK